MSEPLDAFSCGAATLTSCRDVLARLSDDDLGLPTPCADYTVADVGEHLVRSMALLASVAGVQQQRLDGTLEERVTAGAQAALTAWRRRGLEGSVSVGRSVYPAALAVEIIPLELLVHGWDVAHAIGRRVEVPAAVAEYVLGRARELVTPDKRGRSFADEVAADADATALERLVAFTGRRP